MSRLRRAIVDRCRARGWFNTSGDALLGQTVPTALTDVVGIHTSYSSISKRTAKSIAITWETIRENLRDPCKTPKRHSIRNLFSKYSIPRRVVVPGQFPCHTTCARYHKIPTPPMQDTMIWVLITDSSTNADIGICCSLNPSLNPPLLLAIHHGSHPTPIPSLSLPPVRLPWCPKPPLPPPHRSNILPNRPSHQPASSSSSMPNLAGLTTVLRNPFPPSLVRACCLARAFAL
jgi:hypothetical protein